MTNEQRLTLSRRLPDDDDGVGESGGEERGKKETELMMANTAYSPPFSRWRHVAFQYTHLESTLTPLLRVATYRRITKWI